MKVLKKKKEVKKGKISLMQRLKIIKANTTVEPILACYIMPSVLASLATQNLNLEKACLVNLNYSTEICDALKSRQTENYTEYEERVQTLIAEIQAWKNIVQTTIPVLIIFVGTYLCMLTKNNGVFGFFREFFDIGLVMETFRVAFKKDDSNRRLRVCLLLIVVFVVFGPSQGEFTIMYLFTRFRFNWDEVKYSMWSTYIIVTNLLGTAFSISLFSNYLKLDDTLLGIISNTSRIVASFAYAFARNDLEIYLAPLLEILNGTSFIAMRSIATKLVSGEEFGKVNSLFGLAEAMTPLLYGPLYSRVYVATLNVLPGAVFLLGAVLTVPAIVIFGWLYFEHKKDRLKNNQDLTNDDKEKC